MSHEFGRTVTGITVVPRSAAAVASVNCVA